MKGQKCWDDRLPWVSSFTCWILSVGLAMGERDNCVVTASNRESKPVLEIISIVYRMIYIYIYIYIREILNIGVP